MSDAIRWSYELLAPNVRLIFARLAVFAGGFTLSAAGVVCTAAGDISTDEVYEGIEALVAQSLVRPIESTGAGPRFGMLEPIRDFARDRLNQTAGIDALRHAHAQFYLGTVDRDIPPFDARAGGWIEEVKLEESNFLAALDWAVDSAETELALRIGRALVFFLWSPMVRYREQHLWLSRVLELPGPGLEAIRAEVFSALGWAEHRLGDAPAALISADRAMALAMSSGNAACVAWALTIKALIDIDRQDYPAALGHLEPALEIARSEKDLLLLTSVLNRLSGVSTMTGDYDRAMEYLEESLRITQAAGSAFGLLDAEDTLEVLLRHRGETQAAAESGRRVLAAAWALGSEQYVAFALERVIRYAVALGRYEQAARVLGAASRFEPHSGTSDSRIDEEEYQRDLQTLRGFLTEAEFAAARTAGKLMSVAEAVAEADLVIAEWGRTASPAHVDTRSRYGLTARELEVLKLVATGRSNRDIAGELFISVETVKVHVHSILRKLELESRTAAAAFAIRNDLI